MFRVLARLGYPRAMILSHLTVGVNDVPGATAFYDAVLGELGIRRERSGAGFAGWGREAEGGFYVTRPFDRQAASPGNGVSVSFLAPSRAAVDRFWQRAIDLGAKDEGGPGLRPHYHANYYAAYVRDPAGNKIAAVCHGGEGQISEK
jgi:catechol 2,3-dioxygenase-like lactoylglutathione lyase family enzyme